MMLQWKARLKEQGTFAERKAARIARGRINYEFQVWLSSWKYPRELVATFKSRKEAEEFAFRQRGPIAGYSAAVGVMADRYPYTYKSDCHIGDFKVERVEVTQ